MATITATPTDAPRARLGVRDRVRATWHRAVPKVAAAVSAVRHRNWSPALTVSGLAALDIAAWTTFGRGAAWAALGVSILAFDWTRD